MPVRRDVAAPPPTAAEELREGGSFLSRVTRLGLASWSLIGILILTYILYRYVLYPIRIIFPPLVLAMIIVYLLNPVVSALQRRGVRRGWGALLSYVVFLAVVGTLLRYLVPLVAEQVTAFAGSVPDLLERAQASLEALSRRFRLDLDTQSFLRNLSPGESGGEFISRIFSFTSGVVHMVVVLLLGMVLGFYLLVDLPKIQRGTMAMVPAGRRGEVRSVGERMGQALGGFFRGQLLVALFVGLASSLVLWIVGLPYWGVVGMVAGLFNLIPLVGPFIGGIPALFIAFTTDTSGGLLSLDPGWPLALGASGALLLVQQVDNHIISPNVVARTVKLHPVTVMLGLLVGGTLMGLWGMLLAVPVIAAIKILLLHTWDTRVQWPPPGEEEAPPEATPEPPVSEPGPEVFADERPVPATQQAPA